MNTDTRFRIVPLAPEIAREVRRSRTDVAGNTLTVLSDGERHQCRSCLSLSRADEGVILFSHRPFSSRQPYAEVGPVFVHERECEPYADANVYPPEFPRRAVVLRAYDEQDRIVGGYPVGDRPVEDAIADAFANPAVAYLHARNLGYGCYMFRVERA